MHHLNFVNAQLHRKGAQPLQMLRLDDLALIRQTVVHALRSRTEAAARHVPVMVAHHAGDAPFSQFATAFVDLRVVADNVARAIHAGDALPIHLRQHRLERLVIAVDVRDERRLHGKYARQCSEPPCRAE